MCLAWCYQRGTATRQIDLNETKKPGSGGSDTDSYESGGY